MSGVMYLGNQMVTPTIVNGNVDSVNGQTGDVVLDAEDVGALPDSTKYAKTLSFSVNPTTYVLTSQLYDQDGNALGTAQTVDLPLESVVVGATYDNENKKIILTLQNGTTVDVPVADLVSGLQTEITAQNKLSADLVDDTDTTNKFVTASDITNWNGKQNAITGGASTITSSDLTASKALVSNASGKVAVSSVTSTELGYLSGTTSSVQTQLNAKANDSEVAKLASNNTFTGSNTFSGSVSLGGSATATTPATNDNDTSVATTAWGNNFLNGMRSNCITEIPQDINLTLSNGTLTLKSGSKYYMANGSNYQTSSDLTTTQTSDGQFMIFTPTSGTSIATVSLSKCVSGSTDSLAGTSYHCWFDTTNSVVNYYSSDGTTPLVRSLPLAIVTVSNGAISSIDQVFNGFGYIGSTEFAFPDVKVSVPNGRNSDGTLRNIITKVQSLLILTVNANSPIHIAVRNTGAQLGWWNTSATVYNEKENLNYYNGNRQFYAVVGRFNVTNGIISDFNAKTPFHAVDYSDFGNILKSITGYDASATQTLKSVSGVLTWVTDS